MSDSEVVIPKTAVVCIEGVKYEVKPYCVKDLIKFGRELVEGLKVIQTKFPGEDLGKLNMITLLPVLLDEVPMLAGFIALSIDKDSEWLSNSRDLVGVSNLFNRICELNNFGAIIANFLAGWSKLKSQTITASAEQ